ncbi:MAG: hypothetical protein GY754_32180, partial [bacterium]|nr:hypothetical protein [bacterium]
GTGHGYMSFGPFDVEGGTGLGNGVRYTGYAGSHSHAASATASFLGDTETRPLNMSVVWIMKIK